MSNDGKDGVNRGERLQIMLSPDEFAALDDFRFNQRMPSRAAAVRELLRRGLTTEGFLRSDPTLRSGDYGVLATRQANQDGSVKKSRADGGGG
jgi:hypothetical protein